MDTRNYPSGRGAVKTRYANGVLTFVSGSISYGNAVALNVVREKRQRVTLAQWNAGVTILAAPGAGRAYRMLTVGLIAYGGAAGALTTADILATQSAASVKLIAGGQAQLTQSTIVRDGDTGGTILADGLSHVTNDENTAITAGVTGSDLTTATGIDVLIQYVVEAV